MSSRFFAIVAILIFALASVPVFADTVLASNPLPTTNLNNAAGADRSNVSWMDTNPNVFYGGSFKVGNTGETYIINSFTVWDVPAIPASDFASNFSSVQLYGGASANAGVGLLSSSYSATDVTYAGSGGPCGNEYEGGSGTCYGLAQITFDNLGWVIEGGTLYDFGVYGGLANANSDPLFLHASGAPDGSRILAFDTTNLAFEDSFGTKGNGWDKDSLINFEASGSPVPEPASMMLFGSGLAGLAGVVRRKMKK